MIIKLIIGIVIISVVEKIIRKARLDSYDVTNIDNQKLSNDHANGVSTSERQRRAVNGYYDKDK